MCISWHTDGRECLWGWSLPEEGKGLANIFVHLGLWPVHYNRLPLHPLLVKSELFLDKPLGNICVMGYNEEALAGILSGPCSSHSNDTHPHFLSRILMTEAFDFLFQHFKALLKCLKIHYTLTSFYCTEIRSPWWNSGINITDTAPSKVEENL